MLTSLIQITEVLLIIFRETWSTMLKIVILWLAIGLLYCLANFAVLLAGLLTDGLLRVSRFFAILAGVAHNKLLYDLPSFERLLVLYYLTNQ